MVLNLRGGNTLGQIFSHSRRFDQGMGNIRPGQATAVVALDGSGDFEDIREAMNSLPTGGGVVYIKEGNYKYGAQLVIPKANISLIGAGKSTILTGSNGIYSENKVGILIQSLSLVGDDTIGANGIHFDEGDQSSIKDCWVTHMETGIMLSAGGGKDGVIVSNNFCNVCTYGIGTSGCEGVTIIGNTCISNTSNGIDWDAGSDSTITGNICNSNGNDGILLEGGTANNTVSNNICNSNTNNGITVDGGTETDNIITSNRCSGNTNADIVDTGTRTDLSHNITM